MKKFIISVCLITFTIIAHAQDRTTLKGDTALYQGIKYFPEKIIRLGYGTAADKSFAFVYKGAGISMNGYASAGYSKSDCKIVNIKIGYAGKYYIKAKLVGAVGNVTIDLESAFDNKEIIVQ